MSEPSGQERGPLAVLQFIERFAVTLNESGIPRTPARVFAALFATDSGSLTAAELADRLRISPAAVSGAVRYLLQVEMVFRERETGSRRDHYRVPDDVWYQLVSRRDRVMNRWMQSLQEGVGVLGAGTPAGIRAQDSLSFFEFVQKELPEVLGRWRDDPASVDRNRSGPSGTAPGRA